MRIEHILITVFLLMTGQVVSAQANDDPICAGLAGTAFGQCTAAVAVGCDGSAEQPGGCTRIAETFTRLTGMTPPWEVPTIPCGCFTLDQAIGDIEVHLAQGQEMVWYTVPEIDADSSIGIYELISGEIFPHLFAAFWLEQQPSTGNRIGNCHVHGVEVSPSLDESQSCVNTLRKAASVTDIPKFSP